jgi:hypothetical protein
MLVEKMLPRNERFLCFRLFTRCRRQGLGQRFVDECKPLLEKKYVEQPIPRT